MNRTYMHTIALLVAAVLAGSAWGQDSGQTPSVDEIVAKTNSVSYYQGKDGRANVGMSIHYDESRSQSRQFTILRWDAPNPAGDEPNKVASEYTGAQKYYVYFHRPADVNKMVFLVHKFTDKDDDRWLYLPALDRVNRISAADKRTSFAGSHFLYEDVSGRNINLDTHELIQETDDYYVLRNTPKEPGRVEFKYYDMYILKKNFLVAYTYYYDKQGKRYRTYEVKKWEVDEEHGYPVVTRARMTDLNSGGYTDLTYDDVEFNIGVPEDVFTERYLRRAPRQWLR